MNVPNCAIQDKKLTEEMQFLMLVFSKEGEFYLQ